MDGAPFYRVIPWLSAARPQLDSLYDNHSESLVFVVDADEYESPTYESVPSCQFLHTRAGRAQECSSTYWIQVEEYATERISKQQKGHSKWHHSNFSQQSP
jgi:hypothetical protein